MKPNKLFLVVSLIALVYASLGKTQQRAIEKLGKVHFPVSCSAAAQEQFDRAVALLHSFWLDESAKAFAVITQADSDCAMAYWGTAMTLLGNPFTWPLSGKALPDGWAAVEKAKVAKAKTQRERDYIGAVEAFYKDWDKVDHRTRALAYVKAMEELAQRYPGDTEASVFYALALDVTALPTDKTYANQLKAARILEKVFAAQPDHPGVAHYLIHSYDFPPIAAQGLTAARRYASIAPSAPHALHMPSHIFTRQGLWEESIETNRRSAATSKSHFDSLHAMDYLEYAYLQGARDRDAQRVLDEVAAIKKVDREHLVTAYALAAIPARYALELGRWGDAARLLPYPNEKDFPWGDFPQGMAVLVYARALGAGRSGNASAVREEIERLETLRRAMMEAKITYWAQQADIQIKIASAWAAFAAGNKPEALKLMREGADMEDSSEKHPVTPGHVLPARELLGEMLLEVNQPALALKEFEASHKVEPNRFRGLYGAARAAAQLGDMAKAKTYYEKLVDLCRHADAERPELKEAKQFLAKK